MYKVLVLGWFAAFIPCLVWAELPGIPHGFAKEHAEFLAWMFVVSLLAICALIAYIVRTNFKRYDAQHEFNVKVLDQLQRFEGRVSKLEGKVP